MPVDFLTDEQYQSYAKYPETLTQDQLDKYFYLDDKDKELIKACRRDYNKLGYAIQLTTVRFLGTFLANPIDVPNQVVHYIAKQLAIELPVVLASYMDRKATRLDHCGEIKTVFDYKDLGGIWGYRLTRWLYDQAWYGNERPSILFERCTLWLISRKVLLPGISTLTVLIAKVRDRVSKRLWQRLTLLVDINQRQQLENLLLVPDGKRYSKLDELKNGPTHISSAGLVQALKRYQYIRDLGLGQTNIGNIPKAKINHLARYVTVSWAPSIARMPDDRRIAVLFSFAYVYEINALDDALDLLVMLITEITAAAKRLGERKRIRSLGDLDKAALKLSDFGDLFLQYDGEQNLPAVIYKAISKDTISNAVEIIRQIAKPHHDKYYDELLEQYKTVRRFLPTLLSTVKFQTTKEGKPVQAAIEFLASIEGKRKPSFQNAPLDIINTGWRNIVINPKTKEIDRPGYTLCVMDHLQTNMRSRDMHVVLSERWCDPRTKLLRGAAWDEHKIPVCRSLNLSIDFDKEFGYLSSILEDKYQNVLQRLPQNDAIEIVKNSKGKDRIKLSRLEKIEEPESLKILKSKIDKLMPRIDFPELLLEANRMSDFTDECTHISDNNSRISGIEVSLCAVIMAEACNIGIEPLINEDSPELTRNRLSWIQQNCIRAETIARSNAKLVDLHFQQPLAKKMGTGNIASADGVRFTCAVKTVNSGPNKKYYGPKRGLTYYNFVSDQNAGFHGIVITGTLRDSLYLLDGMQDQQTSLDIKEIMTDTAGASEIIFALFWLLGYQFSPRLADVGGARFWRVDSKADYGVLNDISNHKINEASIRKHWEDILRVAVSLKLGHVSASDLIRSLFRKNRPSGLAKALMNLGRIIKTLYLLNYIDSEEYRRHILIQLNKGESRHSLARTVYHGKRGEIHEKYREGQEDQLNALGLATNAIVLWNTVYMQAALDYLRAQGEVINEEDEARLSPLGRKHINFLGHFSFMLPKVVAEGQLRPLNVAEKLELA
ncbi:Tn3 family transposase [Legionella bononiensis]|uniref:Tn3 family transposase n=1 Tax=Legionella bononiensis TaxID=2793102 RepID=A0ABS1WC53_9GAMM|nr:Tn3 family transposase [Legionella bononiensis]MBL7478731.1 Tn3 family transposase [Legionella bononiensis]MBL7526938.1 Tn3 family transposase [Legionella bononiensis]MBL7562547.1 Tn3 family transposase [Legionella bononiensis]